MRNKGWRFSGNELQYVKETLESGFSAGDCGSFNDRLEQAFSQAHGVPYAITSNSGTSTLHMALHSFGVTVGDEVLIPALAPAMCGYAVWHAQATPVYVDVLADTFLMDPEDIERKITKKTKAIMPVHLYGLMCDMEGVSRLAQKYNLYVLEDCAQCFFAKDDKNRWSGTVGDVGSWSFENSKHLSTGDGGIVATNSADLALKMRQFGGVGFKNLTEKTGKTRISRDKFQDPNWERHTVLAYNYRLPELCAAVGLAQMERYDALIEKRVLMAKGYLKAIHESQTDLLVPQVVPAGYHHVYYTFAARFNGEKDGVSWFDFRKKYMSYGGDGIYAAWKTINNEPCFRRPKLGWGEVPVSERLQASLMQFTTNQSDEEERKTQANALSKTLAYFKS